MKNKEDWAKAYLRIDENVDRSHRKGLIKKISYGGEMETLKHTSPNIYKALKKLLC